MEAPRATEPRGMLPFRVDARTERVDGLTPGVQVEVSTTETERDRVVALKCEPLDSERAKAIRHDLDIFETRYGVRSEELATAFTHGGRLNETEDYQEWQFLWSIWQRWTRANRR